MSHLPTTTRPGVRLFFRHRYFVGETVAPTKPPVADAHSIENLLMKDTCYYPVIPLSISLYAGVIETGRSDVLRFQVTVDAASLSYLTLDAGASGRQLVSVDRRVQIDYGICAFNAPGCPIGFFQVPFDQVLTSADYARALAHGFPHVLELRAIPSLALARFVVRDRATGNLGATDVPVGDMGPGTAAAADSVKSNAPSMGKGPSAYELALETVNNFDHFPDFSRGLCCSA